MIFDKLPEYKKQSVRRYNLLKELVKTKNNDQREREINGIISLDPKIKDIELPEKEKIEILYQLKLYKDGIKK